MSTFTGQAKSFCKAVVVGSLAGSGLPLAFTMVMAILALPDVFSGQMPALSAFYLAFLPLIVTFPVVLLASVIFGLPLTFVLRLLKREQLEIYCLSGAAIGSAIPVFVLFFIKAESGYWMAFLGAISGYVTAYWWWIGARLPLHPPPPSEEEL